MMLGLETQVTKCQSRKSRKHSSSRYPDDEIIDPKMIALKMMMLPEMIPLNTQVTQMLKLLTNRANTFLLPIITGGAVRSTI
jgi:hypothetical protein